MRTLLLLVCLFLGGTQLSYGQDILSRKVTFSVIDVSLDEALSQLSKTARINIAYNSDLVANENAVTLSVRSATISSILNLLLEDTRLRYEVIGRQIVLFRYTPSPKKYTISGFITDAVTAEKLILANIFEPELKKGSVSNNYGFYSLTLPEGPAKLQFSYLGYETAIHELDLRKDTRLDITLSASLTLKEVVITAPELGQFNYQPVGKTNLIDKMFRTLPTTGGEEDILRYIYLLPGVNSGADGVGGINVRGGSDDQNLVLLDEVPVYNPTHLAGIFSVFNISAIKSASIYKGNIPARYGNRLSSVIDVRTKDGNKRNFSGEVNLGALAARISMEGPVRKDQTSFFVSGRTSLLGLYVRPISRQTKEDRGNKGESDYKFYDLNARIHHVFSGEDELSVSFYHGRDHYDNINQSRLVDQDTIVEDTLRQRLVWGNTLASLRWNHLFGDRLFANTTLYFSTYDFESEDLQNASVRIDGSDLAFTFYDLRRFESRISSLGAKVSFDYALNANHYMRFGMAYNLHIFSPGAALFNQTNVVSRDSFIAQINALGGQDNPNIKTPGLSAFWEDEIQIGTKWRLEPGLHFSAWLSKDQAYFSLQPRLLINYQWGTKWGTWITYGRQFQPMHRLSASGINLPNDLWVPASKRVRPQEASQFSMGKRITVNQHLSFELAGFYKKMDYLTEYLEAGALGFINAANYENNITTGKGLSYGAEFSLAYVLPSSDLKMTYTWSRAERQFNEINLGNTFLFQYDRTHSLNIVWSARIGEKWRFSTQGIFASGTPTTLPTSTYLFAGEPFSKLVIVYDYPPRNSFKLPDYQRVDAGLSYRKIGRNTEQTLNFGINNILGRQNPVFYRLRTFVSDPTFVQTTLIPFLPYINYNIKF